MGNGISTVTFFCRGGDKVANGEVARIAPTAAQGFNLVKYTANTRSNNFATNAAKGIVNHVDDAAKASSIWGEGARALKWASTHVNPLIAGCAAVKVITADDKERALGENGVGFASMLLAEKGVNKLQKTKGFRELMRKICKSKAGKHARLITVLLAGGTFAAASITGYTLGSKVGGAAIDKYRDMTGLKAGDGLIG